MPIFEFQPPGSKDTFQIDARDDAHAQEIIGSMIGDKPPQTPVEQATDIAKQAGVGAAKTLVNNAGLPGDMRELAGKAADWIASKFQGDRQSTKGVNDLMTGGGESVSPAPFNERFSGQAAPEPTAGDRVKQALMRAPGGVGSFFSLPTSEQVRKGVEGVTGEFRKPQNTAEEYADTIGSFAPAVVAGPGGFGGATAGRVAYNLAATPIKRAVSNAVIPGAMSEAAGQFPGIKGTAAEPYARFAGAMVSPAVTSAWQFARRPPIAPNIPAENEAAWNRLQQEGAGENLTVGQITGNLKRRYNETNAADRAQTMEHKSLEDITRAATRRFGEENKDFRDALEAGHARIGPAMEDTLGKISIVSNPVAPKVNSGLMARLTTDIDKRMLEEGIAPGSNEFNRVDALRSQAIGAFNLEAHPTNPTHPGRMVMDGPALQRLLAKESALSRAADRKDEVGYYAREIKRELMQAADNSANRGGTQEGKGARKAFDDYRSLRRQYANMKAMEEGAPTAGEKVAAGLLTPAALRQIATNRSKADYFLGKSDYAQLASDANRLMTPLPNSGTAQRLKSAWPTQLMGSLIGAGLGSPMPSVGPVVGAAVGSAAAPAVRSRMVRLTPWWLDQEVARRRHIANLLAGDVATQQLTHDPGTSQ